MQPVNEDGQHVCDLCHKTYRRRTPLRYVNLKQYALLTSILLQATYWSDTDVIASRISQCRKGNLAMRVYKPEQNVV